MALTFAIPPDSRVLARVALHPADENGARPDMPNRLLNEAVFLASRRAAAATSAGSHDLGRAAATRRAYELRARWRTVPQGAFVGVATARFASPGEAPTLRLGTAHRARSNPSPAWLAALSDQFVDDPDVFSRLRFTASPGAVRRGGRLETEWRLRRASVRATDAVMVIMSVCENGADLRQVLTAVNDRWPPVGESTVIGTLTELVRAGFVRTDLLPTDVRNDPLAHVLQRLPVDHRSHEPVTRVRRYLARADRCSVGDPLRLTNLTDAQHAADAVSIQERPLTVDTVADAELVVPAYLRVEAARAASVLWRTATPPDPLRDFRERFTERYGLSRAVPLLEATDSAIGIGLTDDDEGEADRTARDETADRTSLRTRRLASLIGDAMGHGQIEVNLDGETIEELAGNPDAMPPATGEFIAQVVAASPQDRAAGRLMLAFTGCCSPDGATAGRFTHLFPDAGQRVADGDVIDDLDAEIVVQPRAPEGATLAPAAGDAPTRIPVGVPARPDDLDPNDLHLVSTGDRLFLWSGRHDRPVHPALYSRLADRLLPPLARFLERIGADGCRPLSGWSWGPFADTPFQPRVRYGPTVLAAARWVLPTSLTRAAHDPSTWTDVLCAWLKTATPAPPDVVVTDHTDQRLPLDLRRNDDRELLRRYVRRGLTSVCEPAGGPDAVQAIVDSPIGRHVLELVIPLRRRTTPRAPARPVAAAQRLPGSGRFLPGSSWLSLAIPSPASCHEPVLATLTSFVDDIAEHVDTWFWLRYSNGTHGPHLRVRFHGRPTQLGAHVLPRAATWCADLTRQHLAGGFTIEPYDQEIERYGGPDAIGPAEQVFATDSALVLGILAATSDPDQRVVAAAISAATIAGCLAGGDHSAVAGRHLDRETRRRFTTLRAPVRQHWSGDLGAPQRPFISDAAWAARHHALLAYQASVKPTLRATCASSMIHMHANRLLGDRDTERLARALAADLLTRTRSRP